MDPLQEITRDRWPEVRDSFKKRWPHGVHGYYALKNQIDHPDLGENYGFKVHCPFGRIDRGVVAFNDKGSLKEVIIFINSEDTTDLEEALVATKLIDWNERLCVPFGDTDVIRLVRKLYPRIGLKEIVVGPTIKHFLSKTSRPYENLVCPPNTYTSSLTLEHIEQVDKVWPHRYATSPRFFELLIRNGLSYGLFSTEDHNLLAWIFINEVGFLTHLYCEEQHRKKGYAEFITKFVSNDQLSKGNDVFCYIIENNINSLKLFRKLEYEIIGRGIWMFVKKDSE